MARGIDVYGELPRHVTARHRYASRPNWRLGAAFTLMPGADFTFKWRILAGQF